MCCFAWSLIPRKENKLQLLGVKERQIKVGNKHKNMKDVSYDLLYITRSKRTGVDGSVQCIGRQ
jgi:hypothetical protein